MFHVRRRPADQHRRRKKKPGSIRASGGGANGGSVGSAGPCTGLLHETQPDGSPAENPRTVRLSGDVSEVGSANGVALQLYGPSIQPRHCVIAVSEGVVTITPLHTDAHTYVNGQRIFHTTILQHGCLIKFGRMATFRFVDPTHENLLNRNLSQSQHFDSGSVYDRSPTSPLPDNLSGITGSQIMHSTLDGMQNSEPSGINSTTTSDLQRAMSPIGSNKISSQDIFSYGKNHIDSVSDSISGYHNNNNNSKMDSESLALSQHLTNSKADLLQDNNFSSPYNDSVAKEQQGKANGGQFKDNYETTFDLDGNVETKSICSAKSGGSGHENRVPRGQEAILPAVLEFPEQCQQLFLQHVITGLDVNIPAFKLAPVYTLYLCARYRASTHYRPELSPTERAHKLTALLHHVATLIQNTVQEKYTDASVQAFWMANSSELLYFLKFDRHISAFSIQAQDILAHTVQTTFSNLVGCFHVELSQVLGQFLEEQQTSENAASIVLAVLGAAMVLLRKCRVNAALTIQLFSQLFHYINVWCFNKVVTSPYMWCATWGSIIHSRFSLIGAWAERQGLEFAADCHLLLIRQCAHLLQAPKNTPEDIANLTSACFKLNSVQLRCLLGGYSEDPSGSGGIGNQRIPPDLVESAVKHAQGVADEFHRADGREITLEESSTLPLSLVIPEDGFSVDVVRGLPTGLAEFLAPLQRSGLCRLAPQHHSQGHWTVYMNGYHGGNMITRPPQQPVIQVIKLQKNSNGMGLSIVAAKGAGQSRLGIYIKSVVPGGAAAADQRLQAGDQLLSVDGHSLVGITQERAAEYLVRTGPVVTLEVAKQGAVLHGLATLLRQPSPQSNRDSVSYKSGTFTNPNPIYLKKTRPESELVTASMHPAESSYSIRSAPILHYESNMYNTTFPGSISQTSLKNSYQLNSMYLNEDLSSSEESLVNTYNIPNVIIDYDDGKQEIEYYDPCNINSKQTKFITPTFSFTDYDEITSSQMRSACQQMGMFGDPARSMTCHREQSVDSSTHSYESDCSYSACVDKNCQTVESSDLFQLDDDDEYEGNISQTKYPSVSLNRSLDELDGKVQQSNEQLNSIELYRLDTDNEPIPFIDDNDSEPLIFEHKSCSKDNLIDEDAPKIINSRSLFPEYIKEATKESKKSKDITEQLKSLILHEDDDDDEENNDNKQNNIEKSNNNNDIPKAESDFLGEHPQDQNFFSKSSSNPNDVFSVNRMYNNDRLKKSDFKLTSDLSKSLGSDEFNDIVLNEYNILDDDDENVTNLKKTNLFSSNDVIERITSNYLKSNVDYCTDNVNNFETSVSNKKNTVDALLGKGKVKALADHFNKINLTYQTKSSRRFHQSNPDISESPREDHNLKSLSSSMANLVNYPPSFFLTKKNNKLSEDEKTEILKQLDDWSTHGTKSTEDYLKNIDLKKSKLEETFFRKIIKLPDPLKDDKLYNLKRFGSLEKLIGDSAPRNFELLPRKTVSFPNVSEEAGKNKSFVEKTKLKIPRKKFPHSYIVKKKSMSSDSLNIDPIKRTIVQSCPNLLRNNYNNHNLTGNNFHNSCPSLVKPNFSTLGNVMGPSYMKICKIRNSKKKQSNIPQFAWIQYGPQRKNYSNEPLCSRRMSERDLPSKIEMESNPSANHLPNMVKSSKSVPALHEHTKQHEVFNPGYSRTSSNNSIPAMPGLKSKSVHTLPPPSIQQSDQNNFYQNLSVYRNAGLGDRASSLRSSQNGLQQSQPQLKPKMPLDAQASPIQNDRMMQGSNQRPQSAYYGVQPVLNTMPNVNGMRTAQSTKDLAYPNEVQSQNQVRGNYPSMPNVSQNISAQSYGQVPQGYSPVGNNYQRGPPMSPLSPQYGQYGNQAMGANQYGSQNMNSNQYNQQYGNPNMNNPNYNRGQAKLAEMSEEVTRRQQRGPMSPHGDQNIHQNRYQYTDGYSPQNGPIMSNMMSPTKQQPPVAPKPQLLKKHIPGEMGSQDIVEGPPLPPTTTHPLYQQGEEGDNGYLASASDPPAVSFYPTQRPGQQVPGSVSGSNPWEREEREKEMETRRFAARMMRDKQINALQALGEDNRTPQQEQQLRALTLERDFQKRAQEAQIEDDERDPENRSSVGHSGLLRMVNINNNIDSPLSSTHDLNLVPVSSNIVSSIQPVSVATSNANGTEQQSESQQENRQPSQPPPPSIQPKSILKSNLRLDNLNSNSPQSPSKTQKTTSFSTNLTPTNLKFDNESNIQKYESKYDHNVNNKNDTSYQNKYQEQKYEQHYIYNTTPTSSSNILSPNNLAQNMSNLNINSNHNRLESNIDQPFAMTMAPPPPERGSSFAVMSQQQALRSNVSTSSQISMLLNQNTNNSNQTPIMKDKRVSFHDNDQSNVTPGSRQEEMEVIREDPNKFIMEAESMLQSPTTPTGSSLTHTPGVIGAQEVYRDPRQRRLEQQKAQQAGSTPIPETLSFKEKMKMFALESGESNTPKDKVKISRAQRDIDAVH